MDYVEKHEYEASVCQPSKNNKKSNEIKKMARLFMSTSVHTYMCVLPVPYTYIGFILWEVKQMKALGD